MLHFHFKDEDIKTQQGNLSQALRLVRDEDGKMKGTQYLNIYGRQYVGYILSFI